MEKIKTIKLNTAKSWKQIHLDWRGDKDITEWSFSHSPLSFKHILRKCDRQLIKKALWSSLLSVRDLFLSLGSS